jgi:hypothetical protein
MGWCNTIQYFNIFRPISSPVCLFTWRRPHYGHKRQAKRSRKKKRTFIATRLTYIFLKYKVTQKTGTFKKPNKNWTNVCRQHSVDRSTDPWLLNAEVVCSSRFLFRSAANCTWLPVRISKLPVFVCHLVYNLQSHRTLTNTPKPNKLAGPLLATSQQLKVHTTHTKNCSVVPPEDGRLTPETCRGLRHNKVFVKVKVY